MKTIRHSYLVLFLLGLVFAAPGISAYFFYTHHDLLKSATTNKGVLLDPPIQMVQRKEGSQQIVNKQSTIGVIPAGPKWQLVLWSPFACEQNCMEQLDKLVRIRLALGRRLYEVELQLLLGTHTPSLNPKMLSVLNDQGVTIRQLPPDVPKQLAALPNHTEIFIANPDSYLVLAYHANTKPKDIYQDIKKLLKK